MKYAIIILFVTITLPACKKEPSSDASATLNNTEDKLSKSGENLSLEEPHIGIIGRSYENGKPVIYKFANESPTPSKTQNLPWLTIISWKYDGSQNNGMPKQNITDKMILFEKTIEQKVVSKNICEHAISRTGNNLKEFSYYINDRDIFISQLNSALKGHNRYPIQITFYEDKTWKEFETLRAKFNDAEETSKPKH